MPKPKRIRDYAAQNIRRRALAAKKRQERYEKCPPPPIEKGIPIWRKYGAGKPPLKLIETVRKMEVGDSIWLAGRTTWQVHGMAKFWREATGFKFCIRQNDEGARAWRVK